MPATKQQVLAAAQAIFDRTCERAAARGHEPHHKPGTRVETMPPSYLDDYLADARAALAAAEACGGSLLRPASKAPVIDISTPQGARQSSENARYYRDVLKPFA